MWEDIIKRKASSEDRTYYRNTLYEIMSEYIKDNIQGEFFLHELNEVVLDMEQTWKDKILEEKGKMKTGPSLHWFRNRGQQRLQGIVGKMVRLGDLERIGERRIDGKGQRGTVFKVINSINKGKTFGKKPKKVSTPMEEDIDFVTGENEYKNNPTVSDKVKQILAIPYEDRNKPPKSQPNPKPDIENMDSSCDCGCGEVSKAMARCTRRTKKTSSPNKGKKNTQCVPTETKGKFRRAHWGQAGVKVTGDSGDTKRKEAFRARHNCKTCKLENGKKRYYSNQCLACRDW